MPLVWVGDEHAPCWFPPDRAENVRGDAPSGCGWVVKTADGFPVCGFVPNEPAGRWEYILDERWKYVR